MTPPPTPPDCDQDQEFRDESQDNLLLLNIYQDKFDYSKKLYEIWESRFLQTRDLLTKNSQCLQSDKISFLNEVIILSERVMRSDTLSKKNINMKHVLELRADMLSQFIILNTRIQRARMMIYEMIEELYTSRRIHAQIKRAIRHNLMNILNRDIFFPDYLWAENNFCPSHFDFTDDIIDLCENAFNRTESCQSKLV